jgi:SAM-dependent methyltransferase
VNKEMGEEAIYSEQWNISAQYFYNKNYYSWMADKLIQYKTVLEVGCGTGYSTLALVERGYKVIAVEKNQECLKKAKVLLSEKGYINGEVIFIKGDIATDEIRNAVINKFDFDVVICWNIGTYWNRKMIEYYLPYMLEYGLNRHQIAENPESSYSELIIWNVCRLAYDKGVAAHIIDRGLEAIDARTDPYYYTLRDEFRFSSIEYDSKVADSISSGGRILTTNGIVNAEPKINITFISILYR